DEADEVRREREQRADEGLRLGEELLREDQRRRDAVKEEVVPLDRGAAGRGRNGAEPHPPPAVRIERFRIAVRRRVGRYHGERPPANRRRRVRVTGSARVGIVARSAVDAGMLTDSSAAATCGRAAESRE